MGNAGTDLGVRLRTKRVLASSMRSASAAVTSSGCSSGSRCPARGAISSLAAGSAFPMTVVCLGGVNRSTAPQHTTTGHWRRVLSAANSSWVDNVGKKFSTVRGGVAAIICWENPVTAPVVGCSP